MKRHLRIPVGILVAALAATAALDAPAQEESPLLPPSNYPIELRQPIQRTPTPRVRVVDQSRLQPQGPSPELRDSLDTATSPGETATPNDNTDRDSPTRRIPPPEPRGTVSRRSSADDASARSERPHEMRPTDGLETEFEEGVEYGRLIVMSQQEGVHVTIDGEAYPAGSMQGVLLWADEEYEVVLDTGSGDESATQTATGVRVINVRVEAGETRILMANLGGTSEGATTSSTNTQRTRRTREERTTEPDDDEIGYLGVSSSPRGIVYVDGENTGQMTPARRIELQPGRHEVRIFYESEEQFSETKNVLIRSGVNTNVFFRLRRDEATEEGGESEEEAEE